MRKRTIESEVEVCNECLQADCLWIYVVEETDGGSSSKVVLRDLRGKWENEEMT
jgi:hypothetical protein